MNVADLRNHPRVIARVYTMVKQPMFSYTSTEEFKEYVLKRVKKENKKIVFFNSKQNLVDRFINLISKFPPKDINGKLISYFKDVEVWLATEEKEIVLACSSDGTKYVYKLDSNGNKVTTDNTYIRIYATMQLRVGSSYLIYTSSGIFSISLRTILWYVTAGVRGDFNQVLTGLGKKRSKIDYPERLKRYISGKRARMEDYAVFNMLMNPLSPTFLQPVNSVGKVYKDKVRKKDAMKIIESERFRNFFIKQVGVIMPELIDEIRKYNSPKDIGLFLKKMREQALESGTTDDQIKAVVTTARFAYGKDMVETTGDAGQLSKYPDVPLLIPQSSDGEAQPNMVGALPYQPYDESKDIEASKQVITDAEMEEMIEETDTIEGYIQDDDKPKPDGKGI